MGISTKSRYALRALLYMATVNNDRPVQLKEISEAEDITIDYLVQIFQKLKKAKIVKSIRGPKGGFVFAKNKNNLTIYEIVKAVGEEPITNFCAKSFNCTQIDKCIIKFFWNDMRKYINSYIKDYKLVDILNKYGGNDGRIKEKNTGSDR